MHHDVAGSVPRIADASKALCVVFDHDKLMRLHDLQHVVERYTTAEQVSHHEHSRISRDGPSKRTQAQMTVNIGVHRNRNPSVRSYDAHHVGHGQRRKKDLRSARELKCSQCQIKRRPDRESYQEFFAVVP
jgi:hypothetical protein